MSPAVQESVALFIAINGTGKRVLECFHILEVFDDGDDEHCRLPMAGISVEDGSPLCAGHVKEEGGLLLCDETMAEIRRVVSR